MAATTPLVPAEIPCLPNQKYRSIYTQSKPKSVMPLQLPVYL